MTTASGHPAHPYGDIGTITGDENLLILAPNPADECLDCGGLIAAGCRRGRPPFIMVLGDGTGSHPHSREYPPDRLANLHDHETRAAVACLGLPAARLLMAGLYDGAIPESGPVFDAVVRAVTLVMWARDCNVVCAPWPNDECPAGYRATYRIAQAVAAGSGVGLLAFARHDVSASAPEQGVAGWRIDIAAQLEAKRAAIAAHAALLGQVVLDDPAPRLLDPGIVASQPAYEVLLRPLG